MSSRAAALLRVLMTEVLKGVYGVLGVESGGGEVRR